MTTHVVLWKWRAGPGVERQYDALHVNAMAEALAQYAPDARVICVTDDSQGITECDTHALWDDCDKLVNATKANLPSCYRRLKLYDYETQRDMGIEPGDRIVSLDLDTLVTGPLDEVLSWDGIFVGWALAGSFHDKVYNGSFQMFTCGTLRDVWEDFDPNVSPQAALRSGYHGSDQAWLSWKLAERFGCTNIPYPVLASYPLHCRRMGAFSSKHRLVFFHGKRKPWDLTAQNESGWIKRYWRAA